MAFDLANQDPDFRKYLVQIISHDGVPEPSALASQFQQLVVQPLKQSGLSATLIVDALDEIQDMSQLLAFFSVLDEYVGNASNVKFLITGKPTIQLRSGFCSKLSQSKFKEFALDNREQSKVDGVDPLTVDEDIRLFLKTRLKATSENRADLDDSRAIDSWPSDVEVEGIVHKTAGLFVIASVVVDSFERSPLSDTPQDRLKQISDLLNTSKFTGFDDTYDEILVDIINDIERENFTSFEELRLIMACVVLSFRPLSRLALAKMLEMDPDRISRNLSLLHPVLIIPDSDSQPIRIFHQLFGNFLTDGRCSDARFHISPQVYHLQLATKCLKFMDQNRTIHNIHASRAYAMNEDIMDAFLEEYTGQPLSYAWEYWAKHFKMSIGASDDTSIINNFGLLNQFFRNQFLWWLEVLSIESNLHAAIQSFHDVRLWLQDVNERSIIDVEKSLKLRNTRSPILDLLDLIDDCERFVLRFFDPMKSSAPHIYHSALPWTPTSSLTREVYQRHLMAEVKLTNAVDATWDTFIRTIPVNDSVRRAAFSHKGLRIAVLGKNCIKIFDAITGERLSAFDEQQSVQSITFSIDDESLVCGFGDGIVHVLNVRTKERVHEFQGHTDRVNSVASSPSGTLIASGAGDRTIRIWNVSEGDFRDLVLEGHEGAVRAVCRSTNGKEVISGSSDNTVRIWDISGERRLKKIIYGHSSMVTSVSSFDSLVASGSKDGIVQIYDSNSDIVVQTLSSDGPISSVQFSARGDKLMYTTLYSGFVWDLGKKKHASTIRLDGNGAVFSPDGGTFVASWGGTFVKIWKPESERSTSKAVAHHSRTVLDVHFAPDGQVMASRSNENVKLWDTTSGECLFTFACDDDSSIAFSPNSAFVAFSCNRRLEGLEWAIWNIRTRRLVKKMDCNAEFVALSSDGTRMVSVSYAVIELWSLETRKCLAQLEVHDLPPNQTISDIAFDSADESGVLVTTDDGCKKSWRISSAPLPTRDSSNNTESASLPFVLDALQESWSHQDSVASSQCYHYERDDEWIVDQDGTRVLWVPPDRRDLSSLGVHGKKVAVGTTSGRVYMVDFSCTLSENPPDGEESYAGLRFLIPTLLFVLLSGSVFFYLY